MSRMAPLPVCTTKGRAALWTTLKYASPSRYTSRWRAAKVTGARSLLSALRVISVPSSSRSTARRPRGVAYSRMAGACATERPGRASDHDGGDDRGRNCQVPPPRSLGPAIPGLEPAPGRVHVERRTEATSVRVPSGLQRCDGGPACGIRSDPGLDGGMALGAGRPVEVPGERAEIDGRRGRRHLP